MKGPSVRINVEVAEVWPQLDGEWVVLPIHQKHGETIEIALSPLAAHNLGLQLADLSQQASHATIGNIIEEMRS